MIVCSAGTPIWTEDVGPDTAGNVCENSSQRIVGAKRRVNYLREEIGRQFSHMGILVRSRVMWAGHMVQMKVVKL